MMQGYVDESGGKGQSKTFVVSALIGEATVWAKIADEWNRVLRTPPSIQYFKMDEAEGLNEQFFGFSAAERDKKIKDLCHLIATPEITVLDLTVELDDFLKIWAPHLGRPAREPYFLPFQMVHVSIAYELLEQGYTDRCEVFFDENKIFGPRAKAWYPVMRHSFPEEIQGILPVEPFFRDDKEILPLQAADLTAWIQRTHTCNDDGLGEFAWIIEELRGLRLSPYRFTFGADYFNERVRDKSSPATDPEYLAASEKVKQAYKDTFGFEWPPRTKPQLKRHSGR